MPEHAPTNVQVAAVLRKLADLLLTKKESWFKVRAYRKVADEIERLPDQVSRLVAGGRLREIPGVGEAIEKKLCEIVRTGTLQHVERLRAELAEGKIGQAAKG